MSRRPVSTLGRVMEVAAALGADAGELARARGDEAWLEIPVPERIRRAEAIWRLVLDALPDRAFPLAYAAAVGPDDFGALGLAVRSAPDLRRAFDRILRFQDIFTPAPPWAWREVDEPGQVALELRPRMSAEPRLHIALAATWVAELCSLVREMTGEPVQPIAVQLPGAPPGPLAEYTEFFGVAPRLDAAWTGLTLRADVLDRPLLRADAGVSAFLLEHLEELAAEERLRRRPTLDQRLRPIIAAAFADGGPPPMEEVARRMGMSVRTLRRRLSDADLGWSELVDETRRELAFSLLRQDELEIAEVAFMLGYSESSAFFRAFRRWTDRTPTEWRADLNARAPRRSP